MKKGDIFDFFVDRLVALLIWATLAAIIIAIPCLGILALEQIVNFFR